MFIYKNKKLIELLMLMVVISVICGVFSTKNYDFNHLFEVFECDVTLVEDIVFDDEVTLAYYDNPVSLNAGTKGKVNDTVTCFIDDYGTDYMRVSFLLSDGQEFVTAISVYPESERNTEPLTKAKIIDISQIESPDSVVEKYTQSREKFRSRKKNIDIIGPVVTFVASVVFAAIILLVDYKLRKSNNDNKVLLYIMLVVDVVLLISSIVSIILYYSFMNTVVIS